MHCVDLGESFPTSIYLMKSASIQPRTSSSKFYSKYSILFNRVLRYATVASVTSLTREVNFMQESLTELMDGKASTESVSQVSETIKAVRSTQQNNEKTMNEILALMKQKGQANHGADIKDLQERQKTTDKTLKEIQIELHKMQVKREEQTAKKVSLHLTPNQYMDS